MNRFQRLVPVISATIAFVAVSSFSAATVTTWPLPAGFPASTQFTVTVDGKNAPVVRSDPATNRYFAYFDFSGGSVMVAVTAANSGFVAGGVRVKPLSLGITPTVSGNTITFPLSSPCKIIVEGAAVNYTANHTAACLFIFATAPDPNPPSPSDPNVIYRGPGLYNETINLTSGQTLYLDGGAVNFGSQACINVWNADNVKIRGRGMVIFADPNRYGGDVGDDANPSSHPITTNNATNLSIEGVKLIPRCHTWSTSFIGGSNITIDNIAIVACNQWHMNGDGIDLKGPNNVIVRNCFIQSDDDAIAMYPGHNCPNKNMVNILVENCVIWAGMSNLVRTGWESDRTTSIDSFTIRNCEIPHHSTNLWNGKPHALFQSLDFSGACRGPQIFKNFIAENLNVDEIQCILSYTCPNIVTLQNWHLRNIKFAQPGQYASILNNVTIDDNDGINFENVTIRGVPVTKIRDIPINITGDSVLIKFSTTTGAVERMRTRSGASPFSTEMMRGSLHLSIPGSGEHSIGITRMNGTALRVLRGIGPAEYRVPADELAAGLYVITAESGGQGMSRLVMVR